MPTVVSHRQAGIICRSTKCCFLMDIVAEQTKRAMLFFVLENVQSITHKVTGQTDSGL